MSDVIAKPPPPREDPFGGLVRVIGKAVDGLLGFLVWLVQALIDLINRAIGILTALNGKSFTKGCAILFSWFLVVFPVVAFLYQLIQQQEAIVSPSFLTAFLSGILSVRAAHRLGKEKWS